MGKKISEDIIAQIPILYEKLQSKAEVARQLGISAASVNKYLAIYNGAPVEVTKKKRVKVDDELIEQINKLYAHYRNMAQVAKELNITPPTVKNHLSEENLKLKERVNDDRDALWFYIFRLFGKDSEDKPVSDWNITQMQKFHRMGMSYKTQLLTLKWYYEVERNPVQDRYHTIGIIPYVYKQAYDYYYSLWLAQENNKEKKIDEYIPKDIIVTIPSPQRKVEKRKLFSFLDEEEIDKDAK